MIARTFEVQGVMKLRLGERRKFKIYVRGVGEKDALEKVYSVLGSRHKVTRNHIEIHSVREVSPEEVSNVFVRSLALAEAIVRYT